MIWGRKASSDLDFDTLSIPPLSLFLSLLRSLYVAPVPHTCTRILHIGATDEGDVRYFTCWGRVPDSPRYRRLRRRRRTSWGRRGEGRMRRRRRRRHDSHADRHRRESRAGERITRPGTGSSLTTTTAKIRASPVASLFPLHRWEEERERKGGREGGCGCVQRLSLKSVTAESRASLSPSSLLPPSPPARGGRHFWPLCVAQIDQARPHSLGRSVAVGRWVTRSGDGRRTALFFCDAGRAAA